MPVVFSGGDLREVALAGVDGGEPSLSRWWNDGYNVVGLADACPTTYEELWRRVPALQTVVRYLSRNMAQLPLQVFQGTDQGRTRLRPTDHPFADTIQNPHPSMTQYRLIETLMSDLAIYDRAYWLKQWDAGGVLRLLRLPPSWVHPATGDVVNGVTSFWLTGPQGRAQIDATDLVWFRGYSPNYVGGESPIEALRQTLYEDWQAYQFRNDMWRRGARVGGVIERPETAPDWSPQARTRFRQDWQQRYGGQGAEAGATPVLEDGMTFKPVTAFSPEQAQFLETHVRAGEMVAAIYQIPGELVVPGVAGNAGAVKELHKSVYQDVLGPWAAQIEAEVVLQLRDDYHLDPDVYVEFNISEKLQGAFEDQAAALQSAVGGPWMTRAEARQRMNFTYLGPETDKLIVPLNVTAGGLASPNDTAPGPGGAGPGRVSRPAEAVKRLPAHRQKDVGEGDVDNTDQDVLDARRQAMQDAIASMLEQQGKDVHAALAAGQQLATLWASGTWSDSMADTILEHTMGIATTAAQQTLTELQSTVDFQADPMAAYLTVSAKSAAASVQNSIYDDLVDAETDPDPKTSALTKVLEIFAGIQLGNLAMTLATDAMGLGSHDAAVASGCSTKTWNVNSEKPRASHAALDGETVPLGSVFSNGARWPGDKGLDADERDGCTCTLTYQREDES